MVVVVPTEPLSSLKVWKGVALCLVAFTLIKRAESYRASLEPVGEDIAFIISAQEQMGVSSCGGCRRRVQIGTASMPAGVLDLGSCLFGRTYVETHHRG